MHNLYRHQFLNAHVSRDTATFFHGEHTSTHIGHIESSACGEVLVTFINNILQHSSLAEVVVVVEAAVEKTVVVE